jgi:hypothetical protein
MPKIFFICQTDWDFELGEALGGTEVFCSLKDIQNKRVCAKSCGVYKITINEDGTWAKEVVLPSRMFEEEK